MTKLRVRASYGLARACESDGLLEQALQGYARVIEHNPRHAGAHHRVGLCVERKG